MSIDSLRTALKIARETVREAEQNKARIGRELDDAIKADLTERGIEIGKTPVHAFDEDGNRMTWSRTTYRTPLQKADTFGVGGVYNGEIRLVLLRKDGSVGERDTHLRTRHVEVVPPGQTGEVAE